MNEHLREITKQILFGTHDYKHLYENVRKLHDIFSAATGVSAGNIKDNDILLPSGKAISPTKAAYCLLELQRTAVFLRGIYKAILQLKSDFPGERLYILYAGCGPYATLLTPLTTIFSADEVSFYMLDINEISLHAAKQLYSVLKINAYVKEWICADAATYKIPGHDLIHMIISETMQNGLQKEPQVDIMLNLMPQLPAAGLFVPELITVTLSLLKQELKPDTDGIYHNIVESLNICTAYAIGRENCEPGEPLMASIPENAKDFSSLALLTDITVFKDEKLSINECGLNLPIYLADTAENIGGRQLRLVYQRGETPGFKYNWID